jgi:hypothetical protein
MSKQLFLPPANQGDGTASIFPRKRVRTTRANIPPSTPVDQIRRTMDELCSKPFSNEGDFTTSANIVIVHHLLSLFK